MRFRRPTWPHRILAACALSAAASTALAIPVFTPPATLSGGPGIFAANAQIALDAAGNATAIWGEATATTVVVKTATRPAGTSTWTDAVDLAGPVQDTDVPQIQLAANPAGALVAIWTEFDGQDHVIRTRAKSAFAAQWDVTQNLSTSAADPAVMIFDEGEAQSPSLAIDAAGDAIATWTRIDDAGNSRLQSSRRTAGTWSLTAHTVSPAMVDVGPNEVDIDDTGTATAVWVEIDAQSTGAVRTATSSGNASWSTPTPLSTGIDAASPHVATSATGHVTAVWVQWDTVQAVGRVASASRAAGSNAWSAVDILSTADAGDAADPRVDLDGAGNALALWSKPVGPDTLVQSRRRAAGSWSPIATLTTPDESGFTPQIAVNAAGAAAAVWVNHNRVVRRTTLPATSSTWSVVTDNSLPDATDFRTDVVMNGSGTAVAVWTTEVVSGGFAQATTFDVPPPSIVDLAVPTTAQAGTAVAMSVNVVDSGAGLGPTSWDFGDGSTTIAGTATAHTFATPGRFTVTVSPVNSFGGSASRQAQITVTTAPPAPENTTPGSSSTTQPQAGQSTTTTQTKKRITLTNVAGSCLKRPKKPCRPRVAFKLSSPATVTLTVRRGSKAVGTFTRTAGAGPTVVFLPAKLGGTRLGAGTYRVVIQAKAGTTLSTQVTSNAITVR